MCSKADTNGGNRLLRCGHRRFFFTLKCHRPSSAQTAHEQRVDAESACPETATFRLDTSRESVTRLENQSRRVPDLELFVVAKILGVKADDLFPRNLRGKVKELAPLYRVKLSRGQVPPTA